MTVRQVLTRHNSKQLRLRFGRSSRVPVDPGCCPGRSGLSFRRGRDRRRSIGQDGFLLVLAAVVVVFVHIHLSRSSLRFIGRCYRARSGGRLRRGDGPLFLGRGCGGRNKRWSSRRSWPIVGDALHRAWAPLHGRQLSARANRVILGVMSSLRRMIVIANLFGPSQFLCTALLICTTSLRRVAAVRLLWRWR